LSLGGKKFKDLLRSVSNIGMNGDHVHIPEETKKCYCISLLIEEEMFSG